MVNTLSNFCSSIICTVIVIIIIEMIIPDGKNKKYVMFVCGLVVTISLIEPVMRLLNVDVEKVFEQNNIKYAEYKVDGSLYEDTLKDSYETFLVDDIINRLKENGYNVSNVKVEYDKTTFEPIKIYMDLEEKTGFIQPIKIEVSKSKSDDDKLVKINIKKIISEAYGVNNDNIFIN